MREPVEKSAAELARENEELRCRLEEAEELIEAVRTGAVDALAIQSPEGPRIFTLEGADHGYRTLIEQMNEGALLLSDDGTILYGNACLAGWLGRALEEVIGGQLDTFIPLDFHGYWQELLGKSWAEGKGKGELPLRSQDGSLRPLSLSMNVLTFHETPVLAVIATDLSAQQAIKAIQARVTEQNVVIARTHEELSRQQAARRAIEQAAAEASRMLEGIPQIAWTTDAHGVTTYLNHRWFDFTGPDTGRAVHSQWQEHLFPADVEASDAHWAECLRTGAAFEMEYRFRNQAGDYRWMLGRALPSRNERGEIVQWIGTFTDIHEHKLALERIDQAQRELQDNNEQLTRANVDLDNFIYTASHDLKAPISNIEGLLQALLLELPEHTATAAPQVAPILRMMQDSVDRFKRTIEHLTEVTKLQKEHGSSAATVELERLSNEVTLDLQPLIEATGAMVTVSVGQCPTLSFSEKNLRSVIYNLLSNALKYRSPQRRPEVRISCRSEGSFVVLQVQDNGLGLDLDHDGKKLFAMFQRLHDHVEGSGIGLYMVKKIVENAGGRIEVESQVGVGSTFSVYFRR
ncbi:ATP-binding protein [Hymenobacter chitinivorans]|uniref:histidine kinase n=1 Tax=Hymenobacter chitinivorans DSM 11115 TaxID=1121954 RepID=A0A2M9BR07_9BACT|nr:ATP-binding protein [Hymenobacter chitinivorans]PJJ60383.1 PAS domain S-box-containing protein [Hymenobacter chitinivorans DSM 11115]